jgi:pyridoxine 5-phosphate synthase
VAALQGAGIRVSLFVEAVPAQLEAARGLGADIVELHTGAYADLVGEQQRTELAKIADGAALASKFGIECHAGHGLSYANVTPIARLPQVVELNIGHFLIGEAIYVGLPTAIVEMRRLMEAARA